MCEHCHESCCENSNLQEENNTKIRVARILIAICIFAIIKFINKITHIGKKEEEKAKPKKSDEVLLLEEIRDLLKEKNGDL